MAGVGPLTQLAARGPQDLDVSGGPWKSSRWAQYTRFALELDDVPFPTDIGFGGSGRLVLPFSMMDVLQGLYLDVTLPAVGPGLHWRPGLGHRIVTSFRLTLGDVVAVDVDGLFLAVAAELYLRTSERDCLRRLSGGDRLDASVQQHVLVPLRLLSNRPGGPGVPLVAMTGARTQVDLELAALASLVDGVPPTPPGTGFQPGVSLVVTGATLDGAERASLLAKPTTLVCDWVLSEDYPTTAVTNNHDAFLRTSMSVDLTFMQRSVRQIILVFLDADGEPVRCLDTCTMTVNGAQAGDTRSGSYLHLPSAYTACTACPTMPVYTLNIGLDAASAQPSGCLDMTQVGTCRLQLALTDGTAPSTLRVYSVAFRPLLFTQNGVSVIVA